MAAKITELIQKSDNFELIRDEIGAILAVESENQQALAIAASEDERLWKLRVFLERSNPWADYEVPPEQLDATPIVNVWFSSTALNLTKSNVVERQGVEGIFNVDVYAYGVSEEEQAEDGELTHIPGDERAARALHRAVRLVRNIIHAGAYTYLNMRGVVGRRWVQSITSFQPAADDRAAQRIRAARLELHVEFNEFSPQVQGQPFELLHVTTKRRETGEIYFAAQYGEDYG